MTAAWPNTEVDWIDIPAGTVQQGTQADQVDSLIGSYEDLSVPREWFVKEVPRHAVKVAAFRIARTCVTRGQMARWPGGTQTRSMINGSEGDHPAMLDWDQVSRLCAWCSHECGVGVRPPSEAEWERAARGDDVREYPWGDEWDANRANLAEAGRYGTTPVGAFPRGASAFRLLDMAGNVDEWTRTRYAPYPGAPSEVPATEGWALHPNVTRGGGYREHRDLARCARRHGLYREPRAGLRLTMPLR